MGATNLDRGQKVGKKATGISGFPVAGGRPPGERRVGRRSLQDEADALGAVAAARQTGLMLPACACMALWRSEVLRVNRAQRAVKGLRFMVSDRAPCAGQGRLGRVAAFMVGWGLPGGPIVQAFLRHRNPPSTFEPALLFAET